MSSALNRSSAIRRFEGRDAIEIRDGTTFDFYTGLPHMFLVVFTIVGLPTIVYLLYSPFWLALWNRSNGQLEYSQRVDFVSVHQVVLVYHSGQCCGQNSRFTFITTNKDAEKLSVGYALKSTEKVNKRLDYFGEWYMWHSEYHQPFPAVRRKCALSSASGFHTTQWWLVYPPATKKIHYWRKSMELVSVTYMRV